MDHEDACDQEKKLSFNNNLEHVYTFRNGECNEEE